MSEQIELKLADGKGGFKTTAAPANIFSTEVKTNLLHQSVRQHLASKRSGTHTVKTRTQVRGGGAKPWRQKGTGRARSGSSSSPIWVGGGVAHGPKQKSYDFRINKKEKRVALCSALSAKVLEDKLLVFKELKLDKISTKECAAILEKAGIDLKSKTLIVIDASEEIINKSLRNHKNIKITTAEGLNVYDMLAAKSVVLLGDSLEKIINKLA